MKEETKEAIIGLCRHAATTFGGYALARGWIDNTAVNALVAAVPILIGAALSVHAKVRKKR